MYRQLVRYDPFKFESPESRDSVLFVSGTKNNVISKCYTWNRYKKLQKDHKSIDWSKKIFPFFSGAEFLFFSTHRQNSVAVKLTCPAREARAGFWLWCLVYTFPFLVCRIAGVAMASSTEPLVSFTWKSVRHKVAHILIMWYVFLMERCTFESLKRWYVFRFFPLH